MRPNAEFKSEDHLVPVRIRSGNGALRLRTDPGTIGKIDRWIEDDLIAAVDAAVDFDLAAEVTHDVDLAQMHHAILDHGDLHAAFIEDHGVSGDPEARGLARDMKLDGAV